MTRQVRKLIIDLFLYLPPRIYPKVNAPKGKNEQLNKKFALTLLKNVNKNIDLGGGILYNKLLKLKIERK